MSKKTKHHLKFKSVISIVLTFVMLVGTLPTVSVFAAQKSDYVDPADNWLSTSSRTNELDMNATVTYETEFCGICNKSTVIMTYRVPEYTRSGETAMNHDVFYSDGANKDGSAYGNPDSGTPGINAYYTGYHLTKTVCQNCGTINPLDTEYSFNKNIYVLNPCNNSFFIDFDNTTYEPYDEHQHTTVLKKGEYCQFCKGTYARAATKKEVHNLSSTVDGQIGNNRFYLTEKCDDCGYTTSEYVAAKSVVSSYYGTADGDAHTVSVSDLSDSGVHTKIRYGTSASDCYMTSAPNYTKAGYYPVYYEISYKYQGETMVENGVSYVWLLEDKKDDNNGGTVIVLPEKHEHDYRYLETVAPSCDNLGYERWQCDGCGNLDKRNYTKATGHNYKAITIREATCKQGGLKLNLCDKCGNFYEETTPVGEHKYKTEKVQPTCRMTGYTNHTCEICGNSYITDMTPIISHSYERITKEPTCTDKGYTTSTCTICRQTFVSDYTEPTGHIWDEGHSVTTSTCTADGVIEYHCTNAGCNEKMIKAESATGHTPGRAATCTEPQTCEACGVILNLPKGHSYSEKVVAPTCTELGYTIYTCESCGDSYKADYVDKAAHDYTKTVTAPTCTALGYTVYECKNCDYKYISDYTDKINHSYIADVTEPTCTASGYTVYTCENCGKNYTADYKDMTGHNPSDWIIDEPATIEHAGEKHIECLTCGEVLSRASIPQLVEKDRTDEDGNSKVGDFSILVTNANGKPIFDSEISIDINDNVTIKLTSGRLLDYADQTIITAINTDSQQPKSELQIFIYDENNNAATGKTDENGQLKVPNSKTSTGDSSGTVGKDDEDKKNTFVVKVTDKTNIIIPNCEVYIGESNNVVVDLPEGIKPTSEYPVIITVTDQHGQSQQGVTVITLGDADYIEKGITDMFGKITLPTAKDGFTDDTGKVRIDGMYVFVNDESGAIENTFVKLNDDSTISVTLPDGTSIDYANRITVTVTDKDGNPQKDISVTVSDAAENSQTDKTDENGKMVVPPLNEDITDENGAGTVNGYNVVVTDEKAPIANAFITISEDGRLSVKLPEANKIDIENRISVVVTDSEDKPVKGMTVAITETATEGEAKTAVDVTDENGKVTVPPTTIDYTDINGTANVKDYTVIVEDTKSKIEKAFVTLNEDGTISVLLPENLKIEHSNRITVTVLDKDGNGVKNISVTVKENIPEATETENENKVEAKIAVGVTDKDGKVIVPPASEGITDKDGKTDISETIPGKDTDGDGKDDTEETKTEYNITVEDTKGKIENAYIEIKDGKITVTLPDGKTLTTSNQTTVTVTDKDNKAVKGVSVTIKDKTTEKAATTDANGKVTLPVKSSGGGSSSGGGGGRGNGGGGYISSNTTNITVTDKNGKKVSVSKSTDKDGKITLTLPNGANLTGDNYYTIKATDNKGNAKAEISIVLKDKKNNTANGTTDKNGMLILPGSKHKAYIMGYPDGSFRPDGDMSRAEAAAIFARLIADKKNESVKGTPSFKDTPNNEWYSAFVGYLEKYNIISRYEDGTFRPDESITRAEFVTIAVRYYSLFNEVKSVSNTTKYNDLSNNYWAIKNISYATSEKWLNGYSDGSFRPDIVVTRAEVVTIINRATGRNADTEFINKNLTVLNRFTDVKNNSHWAAYDIFEASNDHTGITSGSNEIWSK